MACLFHQFIYLQNLIIIVYNVQVVQVFVFQILQDVGVFVLRAWLIGKVNFRLCCFLIIRRLLGLLFVLFFLFLDDRTLRLRFFHLHFLLSRCFDFLLSLGWLNLYLLFFDWLLLNFLFIIHFHLWLIFLLHFGLRRNIFAFHLLVFYFKSNNFCYDMQFSFWQSLQKL